MENAAQDKAEGKSENEQHADGDEVEEQGGEVEDSR